MKKEIERVRGKLSKREKCKLVKLDEFDLRRKEKRKKDKLNERLKK